MCRLFALTSRDPVSPMRAIEALNVMKEGHDGSGVGLFLSGLGGPWEEMKEDPILSGIFTEPGLARVFDYMAKKGFRSKYSVMFKPDNEPPVGTPKRGTYASISYQIPNEWRGRPQEQIDSGLVQMRLDLRAMGEAEGDIMVFSFWPDTIMIKEVGDPLAIGEYLQLDRSPLHARHILAQGRQNTNYAINLYACHPFFIEGISTMTNGENTAFVPIKEYLMSRGVTGYQGYQSDSEVFTHIAHYSTKKLGLDISAYKHVITPMSDDEMADHPDRELLSNLKKACRKLIIDGPNCVIGCLPDGSMFMVQDRKKLRPGVVGGNPDLGIYGFSSEICGLNAAIPDRDRTKDFQPMHLDTAIVSPDCLEVSQCSQKDPLHLQR
ncbi:MULTISPECIES: glutamate synthase [unclassified Pseudodesulfovibrio]|uniref:glutamate synthase n=1 Tax=unclassified Pseudodesulfovibrio TaxID=2661612 RepID=UPI000FEB8FF9|nr:MULTISPECIES: glutamate synthase [unclassified Pseudodesulfovibrio]MCJ2164118.1 glutamate synthase [Pseudodesulfovibrio sp. S3-i]RWU05252.1 glutamate synthase [Pseudodesulfovibrio sp. S3]